MTSFASIFLSFFFFNDTATTEIYTLSLHDALPIYRFRPAVSPEIRPLRPGEAVGALAVSGAPVSDVAAMMPPKGATLGHVRGWNAAAGAGGQGSPAPAAVSGSGGLDGVLHVGQRLGNGFVTLDRRVRVVLHRPGHGRVERGDGARDGVHDRRLQRRQVRQLLDQSRVVI